MAKAYDIMYLEDAMSSIGAMMDYAVNSCGEELSSFYGRFISSGIARMIFCANPRYIAGCSGVELAETVARRTGKELPEAVSNSTCAATIPLKPPAPQPE